MLEHDQDGSVPNNIFKTTSHYRSGSQATINIQVMTL